MYERGEEVTTFKGHFRPQAQSAFCQTAEECERESHSLSGQENTPASYTCPPRGPPSRREGQPARLALTHAVDNPPTAMANSLLLAGKGVPVCAHYVPSAPRLNAYFDSG